MNKGNDGGGAMHSMNFDDHAFHSLSPDDLGNLLDSDDAYLDLDIPDNLFGPDGHILLESDFAPEQFQGTTNNNKVVAQGNGYYQQNQQQDTGVMDAAKSVLASLDNSMHQDHSNVNSLQNAHSAPVMTHTHAHQQSMQPAMSMGHYANHLSSQPMFVRDAQGNFIQVTQGHMHSQPMFLSGVPYHQSGQVHYVVHHQQVPSMSYGQVPVYESASVQNSPGKKSPGKRRRQRQSTETVQQRSARAESGYTEDPTTGQMLRHGPALMATARDNKEVPAIKAIFKTFESSGGFAHGAPSSPFVGVQIGEDGEKEQIKNGQEYSIDARIPSRIADTENAGRNQSITSMVTKELRSFTPKRMEAINQEAQVANLKGVTRDKWSLFWDAHFERPSPCGEEGSGKKESLVDGLKKDVIFLGKFPAREQAARAYDLVALKVLGEDADLNYSKDVYKATLPIVQAHSEEEVIRAIMKDSELARQRTSKYKGVKRTGPGQFEALVDAEIALGAKNKKDTMMPTVQIHHNTETFNA